jgi:GntR family transcriptional repressor for pyruvate dehydrogenase complex
MSETSVFPQLARDPSLAERVNGVLLASIVSGQLSPGDRLPSERELCEQFGVSRTVVREAVRGLQARGVVRVTSGRGAEVVAVPASQIAETIGLFIQGAGTQQLLDAAKISEVRATLEVRMVELACERGTEEDHVRLRHAVEAMEQAEDVQRASEHDIAFHRLIASATKNILFVVLLDSVGEVLMEVRRRSLSVEGRQAQAAREHRLILDAVVAHDVSAARGAMQGHLTTSEGYYDPERRA